MAFWKKKETDQLSSRGGTRLYSRTNTERYSERAAERQRGRVVKRGVLAGVIVVLVTAVSAAGLWFASVVGRLNDPSLITSQLLATLTDADVTKEPFYMLLLGTDGRPGEDTYRSDSIILTRIDPQEKQVTLISIPRDTAITYEGEIVKINATHAYGGPEAVVEAVNELCGVQIAHYAEVSFDGMEQLVDAVGGIDINVPEGDGVDDPQAGAVVIEPGQQHMDGEAALTFCRARYQYADGDYTRMRHQRMVLSALANSILNDFDATKIPGLVDSLADMVVTDLTPSDIVSLANAMRGMDTDEMYSANLPSYANDSTMIDGVSYVFVYEEALAEMMERVDAGEDPEGPQTMGEGSNSGSTMADVMSNSSEDYAYGTDTSADGSTTGSSDEMYGYGPTGPVDDDGDGYDDDTNLYIGQGTYGAPDPAAGGAQQGDPGTGGQPVY